MAVENYGYRDIHDKMDAHVARENNRPEPRRASDRRDKKGKWISPQHYPVTKGKRVKRGQVVHYPYGGKPNQTITRPFNAKKQWKRTIEEKRDQIGNEVTRNSSEARPGCALITVHASEATALAFKLRAALKGRQVRDTFGPEAGSELYRARSERVLERLTYAAETGQTVRIGVYTRNELKTIGSQRTAKKHLTRTVRNLERKLAGNR